MNPNDKMNERLRKQLNECRDRWEKASGDEALMEATLMLALIVLMIHQPPTLE